MESLFSLKGDLSFVEPGQLPLFVEVPAIITVGCYHQNFQ